MSVDEGRHILEKVRSDFMRCVDAKVIAPKVRTGKIISEIVETRITNSESSDGAKQVLFDHLLNQATLEGLRDFCSIMIESKGYQLMQKFGEELLAKVEEVMPKPSSSQVSSAAPGDVEMEGGIEQQGTLDKAQRKRPPEDHAVREWKRQKESDSADWKAVVAVVHPAYDVEVADRYFLKKAIKTVAKDKKLDLLKLMKNLYYHTYVSVERILEANAQHFRHMVRAAELATGDEEDAKAVTTTRTVAELLDKLCIKTKWEDTELLVKIVLSLPEEPRTLAMSRLERYDGYLEVYDDVVSAQDSLQKQLAVPEGTKPQVPVEITVKKHLDEFMNKDCKDIVNLLLHISYQIPRIESTVAAIEPGSTTVVFLIDMALTENIIHSSCKVSSLWAYEELSVTRVRVGDFELNVVQLLTQHFKEALRSGLTGGMDFVRATKALPYQVYALVDSDIVEKMVIRTVYRKVAEPCPEQEKSVSDSTADEVVEPITEVMSIPGSSQVSSAAASDVEVEGGIEQQRALGKAQRKRPPEDHAGHEWKRQKDSDSAGPMSDYNSSALIAFQERLKTNVAMKPHLIDMLEEQAGGFMTRSEAQSVQNAKSPMGRLIEILLGKGDKEFKTFCDMLEKSNHCGWADRLRLEAKLNRQKEDRTAVVASVHPAYDVEETDRFFLEKAIMTVAKNKKLDPLKLKKDLYQHAYVSVGRILEDNAQYFRRMVRAAELATEDEEDARALITTRTVAELLDKLCIKTKWEDTNLLTEIVHCLPEEPRTLAMSLLKRYDGYLEVYDNVVPAQDSLQMQLAVPDVTKPQIPVKVTVSKCLAEFMNKDCNDIVNLLLHNSYKIPLSKIMATDIETGGTTVVFRIDKTFTENIIHSSRRGSSLWAFQELCVTRVRFSDFELNVVQLLTQHFKEALRSGLTGGMDFVSATKALPYQVYALIDPDIAEKLVIRTVYRKIAEPCPEQGELVSGTADSEGVETTPEMYEDNFPEGKMKEGTDSGELLSRVQELENELKDSEWKRMDLTHENMALVNHLKVCQEQKDHTEQAMADLKKRLVSTLSSQGGAVKDSALTAPSDSHSKRIPHRWWLKVSAGSYDTSLFTSSPMDQREGGREMEGEVVFGRDTKSNLLKAVSGTEWMYRRGALERGRRANLRRHQFTRYHRRWLADNVQKEEEDSCKLWLLQSSPDVSTVKEGEEDRADEGKMSEEVTGSGDLLSCVQKLENELKDSERKRMDLIQSNTDLQKILKACREQEVRAQQEIASLWERMHGADKDAAPTAPSDGPSKSDNVQKEEEEWLLQSSLDEGSVCEGEEQGLMSKVYKQALRDYQEEIAGVLNVKNIISDLEPYLTEVEYLQVESKSDVAQVDELFTILLTKGNKHFEGFCHVLEENGYQHWAQQLRSSNDGAETEALSSDPVSIQTHGLPGDTLTSSEYFTDSVDFRGESDPHEQLEPVAVKGFTEEDCFTLYQRAITDNPTITLHVSKVMTIGPPRAGKTALRHHLLELEPPKVSSSTPVMKTAETVCVDNCTYLVTNNKWLLVSSDSGILSLLTYLRDTIAARSSTTQKPVDYETGAEDNNLPSSHEAAEEDMLPSKHENMHREAAISPSGDKFDPVALMSSQIYRELQNPDLADVALSDAHLLQFIDCGGQLAYHDILPLFVTIPAIYLNVFNVSEDLTECPRDELCSAEGSRMYAAKSALSFAEMVTRSVTMVHSLADRNDRKVPLLPGVMCKSKPRVILVGTHLDELDEMNADEKLKVSNEILQKALQLKSHLLERTVVPNEKSQLMFFPVNNKLYVDKSHQSHKHCKCKHCRATKNLKGKITKQAMEDAVKVDVPVKWYLHQLLVMSQSEKPFYSYSELYERCRAEGCVTDVGEFHAMVTYFHALGLLIHLCGGDVGHIEESACLVFTNPSYLFENISKLYLVQFEEVTGGDKILLKHEGKLTRDALQELGVQLNPDHFMDLLVQLFIGAEIKSQEGGRILFVPSVLTSSPDDAGFAITFESTSFIPCGVFTGTSARLQNAEGWEICTKSISRKRMTFGVGAVGFVSLHDHATHISVKMQHHKGKHQEYRDTVIEAIADSYCFLFHSKFAKDPWSGPCSECVKSPYLVLGQTCEDDHTRHGTCAAPHIAELKVENQVAGSVRCQLNQATKELDRSECDLFQNMSHYAVVERQYTGCTLEGAGSGGIPSSQTGSKTPSSAYPPIGTQQTVLSSQKVRTS